jgi:hypothetical protein
MWPARIYRSGPKLLLWVLLVASALRPGIVQADSEYLDFFATIVEVSADRSTLTVAPTRDQRVVIDVRQLGSAPWDQGAFGLESLVLLHARRVNDSLIATGWEQARDGSLNRSGVERGNSEKEFDREQRKPKDQP